MENFSSVRLAIQKEGIFSIGKPYSALASLAGRWFNPDFAGKASRRPTSQNPGQKASPPGELLL
jgi:hypothetical protein